MSPLQGTVGWHCLLPFSKGWFFASYAKGGMKGSSEPPCIWRIQTAFSMAAIQILRGHFTQLGSFLSKKAIWLQPVCERVCVVQGDSDLAAIAAAAISFQATCTQFQVRCSFRAQYLSAVISCKLCIIGLILAFSSRNTNKHKRQWRS